MFSHTRKTDTGTYHFRQALSKPQQLRLGKTELVLSLLTKKPAEAKKRASLAFFMLSAGSNPLDVKKVLKSLQEGNSKQFEIGVLPDGRPFIKKADGKEDRQLALDEIDRIGPVHTLQATSQYQTVPTQSGLTLSQAVINYKQHRLSRGKNSNPETEKERIKALNTFESWHKDYCKEIFPSLNPDFSLASIDRTHITGFRTMLESLDYAPKTMAKIGSYIHQFFAYCQDSGFYPITQILPTTKQFSFTEEDKKNASKAGFQAFTYKQIEAIFEHIEPETPHQHFSALLALFTGARRQEIAGLTTDDFFKLGEYWAIHLPGTKTDNADRTIPLHSKLIELGLLDYVEDIKKLALSNNRIFPYLPLIKNQYGKKLTDDFMPVLELAKIKLPDSQHKFGLHSFRDTFNQELIDNGIEEQKRCELLGQKHISVNKDHYGKEYKLKILVPFVEGVKFPVDFSYFKYQEKQHNEFLLDMMSKGKIKN